MNPAPALPRRAVLTTLAALAAVATLGCAAPAQAVGSLAEIAIRDRDSGETLPVYRHRGRSYVAGRPGARYAITVRNNSGERLLAVMSVDGVNVVTGQTAAWLQSGYVFDPYQGHEISGWRKSDREIAAFEFTPLGDSYAARTGRPGHVGVIGVALFRERVYEAPIGALRRDAPDAGREQRVEAGANAAADAAGAAAAPAAPAAKAAPESAGRALDSSARQALESKREKLGTGHGRREHSVVESTQFVRASDTPDEIVTLYYDSRDNLIAQGVIRPPRPLPPWQPQPFPESPNVGYVPDPPRR